MRLYEIQSAYHDLQRAADAGEDVADALGRLDGALTQKAVGIVQVLRDLELDAEKVEEEIRRLTNRKRVLENNAKRIREHIRQAMEAAGATRIVAPTFTLGLKAGPARIEIVDEDALSDTFTRTKREPNRSAILAHYKETGEIPEGAAIDHGTVLTIR